MFLLINWINLVNNIPNNNSAIIPPLDVNTNTASIKFFISDYFGNETIVYNDGFFSIGNDLSFVDTTATSTSFTTFTIDQIPPEITWVYPNGEEEFQTNDVIQLLWEGYDDSFDSTDITIELSQETGFDFEIEFSDIPFNEFVNYTIPECKLL